jgi:hypothetical protein
MDTESGGSITMPERPRKMSEILKEMSEHLLRDPGGVPSSEAAHVALLFAHVAWNEGVGLDHAREGCRNVWETIEADNPELWDEFKSNDIDAMIDELVRYKREHYPGDRRRILTCGIPDGKVRVEWLDAGSQGSIPDGRCDCTGWCGRGSGTRRSVSCERLGACLATRQ